MSVDQVRFRMTLRKAVELLNDFSKRSRRNQKLAISQIDSLIKTARSKAHAAELAIRELDQLEKQRAYMLALTGKVALAIGATRSLVAGYERRIGSLHEEAAFQLAEAAILLSQRGRFLQGRRFALAALRHAGASQQVSRTLLSALECLQRAQEASSRKIQATRPR